MGRQVRCQLGSSSPSVALPVLMKLPAYAPQNHQVTHHLIHQPAHQVAHPPAPLVDPAHPPVHLVGHLAALGTLQPQPQLVEEPVHQLETLRCDCFPVYESVHQAVCSVCLPICSAVCSAVFSAVCTCVSHSGLSYLVSLF